MTDIGSGRGKAKGQRAARRRSGPGVLRARLDTAARPGASFWTPRLAEDPARVPLLWALIALCVACAGVVALRWAGGKAGETLVSSVLLAVSGWLAALVFSRGRIGRALLGSTPYVVAGLALVTLGVMQASGDPADPVHTHALLGAYLALPVTYMLLFLVRPPREALMASVAVCAAAMSLQLALPPLFPGRAAMGLWTALVTGFWHLAGVVLLFAVPRLRSDRELLRAVMRASRDAMLLLVPRRRAQHGPRLAGPAVAALRVAYANPAAEMVFGIEPEEDLASGGPLGAAPQLHERLAEALDRQAEVSLVATLPTLEGVRWFRVTAAPFGGGVAATFVDVTEHKEREGRALALAHTDPLTGLANRRGFEVEAARRFAAADAGEASLTLCYLDLDGFKAVNDRLGHGAGDELLRAVARRLRSAVRGSDLVARLGGDEFVVLASGLAEDAVQPFFDRLHDSFAAPFEVAGRSVAVRPSLGVVPRAEQLVDALSAADAAMYDAKQRGGGVVLAGS